MRKNNISQKRSSLIRFALGVVIIVFINIIGNQLFTRFDLTADQRYTVSEDTRKLLRSLDDVVYFQIYLDGYLPPSYKRLQRATKEMLDEFRVFTDNIQYEFISPSTSDDFKEREAVYDHLESRGLVADKVSEDGSEGVTFQTIFPGAIISYKSKEKPLQLLHSSKSANEFIINKAIEELEFNLAYGISLLVDQRKPKIAFIEGHGELSLRETADITRTLQENYLVERVRINERVGALTEREESDSGEIVIRNKYKAIIVAGPDSVFSERDKFIIDQYIMHGGRVLWLIDPVFASMDSLQHGGATMGVTNNIYLDDMFFNYGVRLNADLIMDLVAMYIPVTTGTVGGQPQYDFFPWFYFPLVAPQNSHPVVSNLNAVKTEFISSIDTIRIPGIEKTYLLNSSPYSRRVNAPVYINLDMLGYEPDQAQFNEQFLPVAVLLEGQFTSLYKNRMAPAVINSKEMAFAEISPQTAMIVVSDADIIKNQFSQGYPLPLGFDKWTQETLDNKTFILNAIDYLTEGSDLITIRSRSRQLRQIDKNAIKGDEVKWQLANVVIPPLLVIIFGILYILIRKKRFTVR